MAVQVETRTPVKRGIGKASKPSRSKNYEEGRAEKVVPHGFARIVQGGRLPLIERSDEEDILFADDYVPIPSRYPSEKVTVRIVQGKKRQPDLTDD